MRDLTFSFDHIAPHAGHVSVPNDLKGFDWVKVDAVDKDDVLADSPDGTTNGYISVLKSGDGVASACQNGETSEIKCDGSFTLKSGWFASAWLNGMTVTFTAFRGGHEVGHLTTTLGVQAEQLTFDKHFRHIDSLTISTSGGTDAFPGDGATGELVFDDLSLVNVHARAVPDHDSPHDPHPFNVHGYVPEHHVFLV